MDKREMYVTDPVGKCRRQVLCYSKKGTAVSRIDKYLKDSETFDAFLKEINLRRKFDNDSAKEGILKWIDDRKKGLEVKFPVMVDESNGIFRLVHKDRYGILADVVGCLYKRKTDGKLIKWEESKKRHDSSWAKHTKEEIDLADDSKSGLGKTRNKQGEWRKNVEALYGTACMVTGCKTRRLLRASHIKRYSESATAEAYDPNNGLILAVHIDAAFEYGYISFDNKGKILISKKLSSKDIRIFNIPTEFQFSNITSKSLDYLRWHRKTHGFTK